MTPQSQLALGRPTRTKYRNLCAEDELWRLKLRAERFGGRIEPKPTLEQTIATASKWSRQTTNSFFINGYRRSAVKDAFQAIAQGIVIALEETPLRGFVTSVTTSATFKVSSLLRQQYPSLTMRGVASQKTIQDAQPEPNITEMSLSDLWDIRDKIASQTRLLG